MGFIAEDMSPLCEKKWGDEPGDVEEKVVKINEGKDPLSYTQEEWKGIPLKEKHDIRRKFHNDNKETIDGIFVKEIGKLEDDEIIKSIAFSRDFNTYIVNPSESDVTLLEETTGMVVFTVTPDISVSPTVKVVEGKVESALDKEIHE